MTQRQQTALNCLTGNKPRESCGKTCKGDRDDEWMGVSLARQDSANGRILVSSGAKRRSRFGKNRLMRTMYAPKNRPDYSHIIVTNVLP